MNHAAAAATAAGAQEHPDVQDAQLAVGSCYSRNLLTQLLLEEALKHQVLVQTGSTAVASSTCLRDTAAIMMPLRVDGITAL